ncbi:DNA mismatch repair endonuclease MutL [Fusobacterium perfoetens]|uniref:DNA mismatch repair endonuclease MutL n=1 Tax=Fusobacterium TaxID=848 RepID=UPI001477394C|nr:DNA mismatch repair endonuclease MutL [Fusobacterium perfoetens]NME35754.1 DNA mismatch repair endonuclease MutL [Fusobacterium sp. FSA-380-WT-3A]
MRTINILDEKVSNMIAAGEVVERPANMIKELLENSIDAKSTEISINIKNDNRYVKISDNGIGMSKEDLLLCIERHATSKISTKEDLFNIMTYGFRGEALSSISSVSKMTISSKDKDSEMGTMLTSLGGKITNIQEISRGVGTEIEVKDLFFNTPARLKFLKKEVTEFRAIKDVVLLEALANPNVSITLLNEGKEVLRTSGRGMKNTILEIFGKSTLENLVSFPLGFLGNISLNRSNKDFIFIFINNRPVKSQIIENALIDGYYTKLMKGRYPFAILFLELDPKDVDVNVHPTKKIVKFSDEEYIYNYVYDEVNKKLFGDDDFIAPVIKPETNENFLNIKDFQKEVIQAEKISLDLSKPKEEKREKEDFQESFKEEKFSVREPIAEPKIQNITEEKTLEINKDFEKKEKNLKKIFPNNEKIDTLEGREKEKSVEKIQRKHYKIIGQLNDTYILIERDNNLEIYDQHIIHERILYEKYKKAYYNKEISIQHLLVPIKFKVSNKEREIVEENIEILKSFGFDIDFFEKNDILVRGIPNFKILCSVEELVKNIIEDLKNSRIKNSLLEESIIMTSCKGAIKANQKLSFEEMEILLDKLFEIEEYTCPHGRPILLKLSLKDIEKHFGRLGSK